MDPLFRWPGGKRWLAPILVSVAKAVPYTRYIEPFAGGAAGYFAIAPNRALLADSNYELITTYSAVAEKPRDVYEDVLALPAGRRGYELVRESAPSEPIAVAARFLYLRAHAFGGLYRVNRRGKFNVPYGGLRRKQLPCEAELVATSAALKGVTLDNQDFQGTLASVSGGELVYLDPPYIASKAGQETFNRYVNHVFDYQDHEHLAKLAMDIVDSGAFVIVSNSYATRIRSLYSDEHFFRFRLDRYSRASARTSGRGVVSELFAVSRNVPLSRSSLRYRLRAMR